MTRAVGAMVTGELISPFTDQVRYFSRDGERERGCSLAFPLLLILNFFLKGGDNEKDEATGVW